MTPSAPALTQRPIDELRWVLTVEADVERRYVSGGWSLLDDAGAAVAVRSGLVVDDLDEALDAAAADVQVAIPAPSTAAELRRLLSCVVRARAELAIVPVRRGGGLLSQRYVVASGRVVDVSLHPERAEISLQVRTEVQLDTGDLCPPTWTVEDGTWPGATEPSRGKRVPLVYGAPGAWAYSSVVDEDIVVTAVDYTDAMWGRDGITMEVRRATHTAGVTPALAVDHEIVTLDLEPWDPSSPTIDVQGLIDTIVVCQGHSLATGAELWARWAMGDPATQGGWITADVSLSHGYDRQGRPVTLADISGLHASYRRAGEWLIAWTDGGPGIYGRADVARGSAGAVAEAVLRVSGAAVEWSSVRQVRAHLDRYRLHGYVDDSVTAGAWVSERLRPLGVHVVAGAQGMRLVLASGRGRPPVARLDLDADARLIGAVTARPAEASEVLVTWASTPTTSGRQVQSRVRSLPAVPGVPGEELTLPEVADEATAIGAAELLLERLGPAVECVVDVPVARWAWLRVGDVVDVVSTQLGWAAGPASRWLVQRASLGEAPRRRLLLRRVERATRRATATAESAAVNS